MGLQETKKVRDIKKASPRLGKKLTSGDYIFDEWRRKYPDLDSNDGTFIKPCKDAEYVAVVSKNYKCRGTIRTVSASLDYLEGKYVEVIRRAASLTGVKAKTENPKALAVIQQAIKEVTFAGVRYGYDARIRFTEKYRADFHNTTSGYFQKKS